LSKIDQKIDQLLCACSRAGWDSYGARPIHPLSAALAHRLSCASFLAAGHLSPHAEGGYLWEWEADGGTYFVSALYLPDHAEAVATVE